MKTLLRPLILAGCLLVFHPGRAQPLLLQPLETGTDASLRALSVVSDEIAWTSGTKGTVARTIDGGKTWGVFGVQGMEKADFRTLYAFDAHRALIANVGSPGKILRTEDGGKTWQTVYTNTHPDTFIDGIDFWNDREGIVYGDPIQGRMLLLQTKDGGESWHPLESSPKLEPGEASFAASGTGIRCVERESLLVCTGGSVSRLWKSVDKGITWTFSRPPVIQGKASAGIFSVAAAHRWVVVGGDFQDESLNTNHHLYSDDQGKTWKIPKKTARGYRECVEYLGDNRWISVGPTGIDLSEDDGITWSGLSDARGLHVIRRARTGTSAFAAGSSGAVYRLK
jgi:photosystem II stability/assembly factor-like uncharacterized protein